MSIIRQRTRNLLLAGGIGAMIVLLFACFAIYFGYQWMKDSEEAKSEEYEKRITLYEKQMKEQQSQTTSIYVLSKDIPAGTLLTEKSLTKVSISKKAAPQHPVDITEAVGKYTKISLQMNTPLSKGMLFEEGITPNDLRLQEFSLINLPIKLKKEDFVDVRIKFPTGHDFIVLSKKKVKDLMNGTVWHEMNEQEILTMSSAIVDAYIENAEIYSLTYVDPYMQNHAIPTYPANPRVLDLIESDPNIVKVASMELEKRLRVRLDKDLAAMDVTKRHNFQSKKGQAAVQQPPDATLENTSPLKQEQQETDHPSVTPSDTSDSIPKQALSQIDIFHSSPDGTNPAVPEREGEKP
ncbi:SAF domain-containing protein [Paenibacillus sp. ACRRX]|uniref:SAF domain-containing protein n=1 Tax=Paenibacillus sp. ACRRX TaxID=2918206 RepID=UPI001EF559D9|nr:SAF domain-containing protein [Paenibacillus sp. ACRRX]MCG7409174.1 SAF domain-containing protein [Paenibacillus sp. ACRRX]